VAALFLAASRRGRGALVPLAIVGSIGQVSMVNSFCHLHTPLLMTVTRTFNGLWLGVLFGLLLTWLVRRWLPTRSEPPAVQTSPLAGVGAGR
jgi:hypothetical protein